VQGQRVLLTGGAGFLGANLTRELLRQGADVHVLLRGKTDRWRLADVADGLSLHRADLREPAAVQAVVAAVRPRVLFHLAMPSGHPRNAQERGEMLEACVLGTSHVLEACAASGVARVVQLGSFLEYGPRSTPARETDALEPVTPRGAAKAAATLWCRAFARERGLSAVVLRVFSAYGPWEGAGRLVATAVRAALEGRAIRLAPDALRDYVLAEDVVAACLLAAGAELPPGEVVNVGSGCLSSNLEVVSAVEAACGRRLEVEGGYPARPADASACAADLHKARTLLGWQPRFSLGQGIQATLGWARERAELAAPVAGPTPAPGTAR
jgi:nucleoside-diphosphate-sugar epimerase